MYRFLVLVSFIIFSSPNSADSLEGLVNQRLGHMKSVAIYKWNNQLPIEDLEREKVVLKQAAEQGLSYSISPDSSRDFFQFQIDAAKEIQRYWFDIWQSNPLLTPGDNSDLVTVIRPELLELGSKIIIALGQKNRITPGNIQIEGLSLASAEALENSILKVEKFTNQLDQVLASGILRVGTTGDYAPFTHNARGQYRGIDIDMAEDLAQSLGVSLLWVNTSWPSLMDDFEAGEFDIAMGGISINLNRQQKAFFSLPYQRGGKTPIIRCEDKQIYQSLADIDRVNTRLIVNPGGTNDKFVQKNIKQAPVIIHKDNRTIFLELTNNNADVMITDKIEVDLQTAKHPSLCAAMPNEQLTFSEKGYLLPRDTIWKAYIDTWLHMRMNDGFLAERFQYHLTNH